MNTMCYKQKLESKQDAEWRLNNYYHSKHLRKMQINFQGITSNQQSQ